MHQPLSRLLLLNHHSQLWSAKHRPAGCHLQGHAGGHQRVRPPPACQLGQPVMADFTAEPTKRLWLPFCRQAAWHASMGGSSSSSCLFNGARSKQQCREAESLSWGGLLTWTEHGDQPGADAGELALGCDRCQRQWLDCMRSWPTASAAALQQAAKGAGEVQARRAWRPAWRSSRRARTSTSACSAT